MFGGFVVLLVALFFAAAGCMFLHGACMPANDLRAGRRMLAGIIGMLVLAFPLAYLAGAALTCP